MENAVKNIFVIALLGALTTPAFAADEAAALDIAKKNGCLACHAMDRKVVGPAWKEVGNKYAGDPDAAARLTVKVKKGGKGVWGEIPMPPNATVKDADIRTLVEYVLTLK